MRIQLDDLQRLVSALRAGPGSGRRQTRHRARWLALAGAALVTAACGDNVLPDGAPLEPASELAILAHQDDDLILMQPDLHDAVVRGAGVTNVYVTAGNGTHGVDLAETRYEGLLAAYATVAGTDDWSCGWISVAGHAAEHCRFDTARISLVFLGYPDGQPDGSAADSLLHLWQGDVTTVHSVGRRSTTYSRTGVIEALTEIINIAAPATLRTLEVTANHGHDHSDHMLVGAFAVLATAASEQRPKLISYRGYNIEDEPANTNPALFARSLDPLLHYEACATGCASCGAACSASAINPRHIAWMSRHYAIGMRHEGAGQLRIGDGCVSATRAGGNAAIADLTGREGVVASLVDCAAAPAWQLDEAGALRSGDRCLTVTATGEIVAADCSGLGAAGRFFLDDEGHLWSGIIPPPSADMELAHLYCVGQADGQPRAALCGAGNAPTWEFARPAIATPRTTAGISGTGRAVRIARLAPDALPALCAVEPARGLVCAPGLAGGGLGPAVPLDSPAAPLAIEPESLVLGDVDGDGLTDACGRGADGLVCATAVSGYRAALWSSAFASAGPATASDRSLASAHGKICGLSDAGVACIDGRGAGLGKVRSTWPDRDAALWIAELDGDDQVDWCTATATGPACGLGADRALTRDGIPWGYAFGGIVEGPGADGPLADTATAAVTDVDGDGRDDLCTLQDDVIACARSLGGGFAPRAALVRLPAGMTATVLWAEPGAPGQLPRLCAGDASTIACADL